MNSIFLIVLAIVALGLIVDFMRRQSGRSVRGSTIDEDSNSAHHTVTQTGRHRAKAVLKKDSASRPGANSSGENDSEESFAEDDEALPDPFDSSAEEEDK